MGYFRSSTSCIHHLCPSAQDKSFQVLYSICISVKKNDRIHSIDTNTILERKKSVSWWLSYFFPSEVCYHQSYWSTPTPIPTLIATNLIILSTLGVRLNCYEKNILFNVHLNLSCCDILYSLSLFHTI